MEWQSRALSQLLKRAMPIPETNLGDFRKARRARSTETTTRGKSDSGESLKIATVSAA